MNKYTEQELEGAALILQVAASNQPRSSTWNAERWLFGSEYSRAGELARDVLATVPSRFHGAEAYAEAEARIRTGKVPK